MPISGPCRTTGSGAASGSTTTAGTYAGSRPVGARAATPAATAPTTTARVRSKPLFDTTVSSRWI